MSLPQSDRQAVTPADAKSIRAYRTPPAIRSLGWCALLCAASLCGAAGSVAQESAPSSLFAPPGSAADALPTSPAIPCVASAHVGDPAGPGYLRSLGRYGPGVPLAPGAISAHAPVWDQLPTTPQSNGAIVPPAPIQHDCRANEAPFTSADFSPDPNFDCYMWDGCTEMGVYGSKHLNPTQRPWLECFTPLYAPGPWPPSYTFLGVTNPVRPKFYVYGDYRMAMANNNNVVGSSRVDLQACKLEYSIVSPK